jgi:tyrosyl-tRNA synthetase
MKNFLAELSWRGLIEDQTPGLAERLERGPITGYVGFDPTAPSLQLGNLVPVMLLTHLQRAGGTPIIVLGGGTGLIGDPSGRRAERPLLDAAVIEANVARQASQFARFLDFDPGQTSAKLIDNAEWLTRLGLLEFLRDTGKYFTLSYMLQKESVKSRLDSGISYTEFSYMLLQAYDFLELYRTQGCELQLGGSDQWGNITAGRELVRRVLGDEVHGLCAPLLTNPSGTKFGKSEGGNVWLDPELTSPYQFHQFWVNADDRDVPAHLRAFSLRSRDEIDTMLKHHAAAPGTRIPHRALAREMTERVHGPTTAARVEDASRILFGELDPRVADAQTWAMLASELPRATADVSEARSVVDLATRSSLCKSKGEARRLIQQGGLSLNGQALTGDRAVGPDDLLAGGYLWLRRGKKTDAVIVTASP